MSKYKHKPKYKAGDLVKLRDKPPADRSEGPTFTSQMNVYLGHEYIIDTWSKDYDTPNISYRLHPVENCDRSLITVNSYWFDERWIESLNLLPEELFEV